MRTTYAALGALILSATPSCTVHIADDLGNAAEALTDNIELGVPGTRVEDDLPEGVETGPQVGFMPDDSRPLTVRPGEPTSLQIPYSGGAITGVSVSFGGSSYFSIPVSTSAPSGSVMVPVTVMGQVCSNLADVCHQIKCYEQVTTAAGTVSKSAAMQMVLNCTGGRDCSGRVQYCCASDPSTCTGTGTAAPTDRTTSCSDGRDVYVDACIALDLSDCFYSVGGREFHYACTEAGAAQRAAMTATDFAVSACRGTM
jgi:hypothetical protein